MNRAGWEGSKKVYIRQHASAGINLFVLASGIILEVELGMPVGRLVLGDTARGTVASCQIIEEGRDAKSWNMFSRLR